MAHTTAMEVDMDIDLDIDADFDPEIARMQEEAARLNALPSQIDTEPEQMTVEVAEGELAPVEIAATKVHIVGLAELTTSDIENFARDHYDSDLFRSVEWVDDNSANLVYDTAQAAKEALQTFSREFVEEPFELRAAKSLTTHPHVDLYVRQAIVTDQKVRGAAHQSAFYLNHPEYDPLNKPRGRGRGRGGRVRGRGRGGYREDDRRSRRSSNAEPFDVNLYDDGPKSIKNRAPPRSPARKGSFHSEEDLFAGKRDWRRTRQEDEDLFAGKPSGRLRNRSASPIRDGDGRYGFSDDKPYRQVARRRSPPPVRPRSHQDNIAAREDLKTELFPNKKNPSALSDSRNGNGVVELFPDRTSSPPQVRNDLFPDKVNQKRQDARKLYLKEVTSAMGRQPAPRGDLFSRIGANSSSGRLTSSDDFSFKGASQGTSFLGASKERTELFPKGGGGGRDLFEDKIRSRRRGAEHFN